MLSQNHLLWFSKVSPVKYEIYENSRAGSHKSVGLIVWNHGWNFSADDKEDLWSREYLQEVVYFLTKLDSEI
jgi:hypothetical protein